MKTKWLLRPLAALLVSLLLLAVLPINAARAETALATGYVNANSLNLRAGAGTGNRIVAKLSHNTAVNIYATAGTWLRIGVPSTGKTGYVSGHYITINGSSLSGYGIGVTTASVHLRKTAATDGESLGVVANNTGVSVYSADGTGWYYLKVHSSGSEGYIPQGYVNVFSLVDGGTVDPGVVTPGTGTSYITGNSVNFRTGPSTSYKSFAKLRYGDVVTVLGSSGNWYRVTAAATGKTGYVYASYVNVGTGGVVSPDGGVVSPTVDPTVSASAYINASGVNFRTGPSTSYKSQGKLAHNTAVTVTGSSGNWYKITVNSTGKTGYVYSRYVTQTGIVDPGVISPGVVSPGIVDPTQTQRGYVNTGSVNFRTGPSTSYKSNGLLYYGEIVTVLGSSGNWYKVTVDATGKTGYVYASYISFGATDVVPSSQAVSPTVTGETTSGVIKP